MGRYASASKRICQQTGVMSAQYMDPIREVMLQGPSPEKIKEKTS